MTLLFLDPCRKDLAQRLEDRSCNVEHRDADEDVPQALRRVSPEIVVVRSSVVKEPELEAAKSGLENLRLVMRAGAGVDNLAVPVLAERGVVVANAAGANAIAVAELTLAHLLNLDRRVSDQVETLRSGQWRRLEFAKGPKGLYGRSLAVLGVGYIGREVIRRAVAFGMRVRAWSRSLTEEEAKELSADFCACPEAAVEDADALSVHLALSEQTRGLVDAALLSKLRPGALVVNMSRGGIVDEVALLKAVEARGLRAGLDVFANEPGSNDTRFEDEAIMDTCGVYGTHHTGARTQQAAEAVEDAVVAAVDAYLEGRTIPGRLA